VEVQHLQQVLCLCTGWQGCELALQVQHLGMRLGLEGTEVV